MVLIFIKYLFTLMALRLSIPLEKTCCKKNFVLSKSNLATLYLPVNMINPCHHFIKSNCTDCFGGLRNRNNASFYFYPGTLFAVFDKTRPLKNVQVFVTLQLSFSAYF
jgi:hypothetical protein